MACSIEEEWKPLAKYLYYFGVTREGMRRMLTIKPMVFCIDLETTIVPKVCHAIYAFVVGFLFEAQAQRGCYYSYIRYSPIDGSVHPPDE